MSTLFPYPCLACQELIEFGNERLGLCVSCQNQVKGLHDPYCIRCGRALFVPTLSRTCGFCLRVSPAYQQLFVGFEYSPPLDCVVHGFKFLGFDFLGEDLALGLLEKNPELGETQFDCIVPIPLTRSRLWNRGFNQAAVLAKSLSRSLGIPVRSVLRRKHRPRQARLTKTRRLENLNSSFSVREPLPRGSRVLLVDDVVTTGSTLEAATKSLQNAGASAVIAAVAARTPTWGERTSGAGTLFAGKRATMK